MLSEHILNKLSCCTEELDSWGENLEQSTSKILINVRGYGGDSGLTRLKMHATFDFLKERLVALLF